MRFVGRRYSSQYLIELTSGHLRVLTLDGGVARFLPERSTRWLAVETFEPVGAVDPAVERFARELLALRREGVGFRTRPGADPSPIDSPEARGEGDWHETRVAIDRQRIEVLTRVLADAETSTVPRACRLSPVEFASLHALVRAWHHAPAAPGTDAARAPQYAMRVVTLDSMHLCAIGGLIDFVQRSPLGSVGPNLATGALRYLARGCR